MKKMMTIVLLLAMVVIVGGGCAAGIGPYGIVDSQSTKYLAQRDARIEEVKATAEGNKIIHSNYGNPPKSEKTTTVNTTSWSNGSTCGTYSTVVTTFVEYNNPSEEVRKTALNKIERNGPYGNQTERREMDLNTHGANIYSYSGYGYNAYGGTSAVLADQAQQSINYWATRAAAGR